MPEHQRPTLSLTQRTPLAASDRAATRSGWLDHAEGWLRAGELLSYAPLWEQQLAAHPTRYTWSGFATANRAASPTPSGASRVSASVDAHHSALHLSLGRPPSGISPFVQAHRVRVLVAVHVLSGFGTISFLARPLPSRYANCRGCVARYSCTSHSLSSFPTNSGAYLTTIPRVNMMAKLEAT